MVVHHRCSGCYETHKRWHKEVEVIGVHLSERIETGDCINIQRNKVTLVCIAYLWFIGWHCIQSHTVNPVAFKLVQRGRNLFRQNFWGPHFPPITYCDPKSNDTTLKIGTFRFFHQQITFSSLHFLLKNCTVR